MVLLQRFGLGSCVCWNVICCGLQAVVIQEIIDCFNVGGGTVASPMRVTKLSVVANERRFRVFIFIGRHFRIPRAASVGSDLATAKIAFVDSKIFKDTLRMCWNVKVTRSFVLK